MRKKEETMEIKDMTLEEIRTRKAELKDFDIEKATLEEIEQNTEELRSLNDQEAATLKFIEERKAKINAVVNDQTLPVIESFKQERGTKQMEFTPETVLKSKEYRSAWAKSLMMQPLTEVEKRAVGTALTTTATTYVGAGAGADGVNNGGLFIPEEVNLALMEAISLASPFFADIAKTAVLGTIKFPYRKSGSGAEEAVEGVSNVDGQVEWAYLTPTMLEVSETIRVTWKLEAMTVDGFINYITEELATQITEKIANDVLYGDGTGTVTGVTVGAIDGEYTIGEEAGNVIDVLGAIEAGIKLVPKKYKAGSKIYIAQDIMESISFMRDSNDNFVYSPINGGGINSIATYQVAVDPYLNAGDFIIGNGKYYKFNQNEPLSITRDVSGKQRINDYTGYEIVSGAPQPGVFVYGKKSA